MSARLSRLVTNKHVYRVVLEITAIRKADSCSESVKPLNDTARGGAGGVLTCNAMSAALRLAHCTLRVLLQPQAANCTRHDGTRAHTHHCTFSIIITIIIIIIITITIFTLPAQASQPVLAAPCHIETSKGCKPPYTRRRLHSSMGLKSHADMDTD
jgi:hypothetical protein